NSLSTSWQREKSHSFETPRNFVNGDEPAQNERHIL
ncbi:MAG: hypothetical protein RL701_4492, partial [Pseudomonadota bacterium]